MSKYNKLFEYFKNNNQEDYTLSFKDIQNITDNKIDHLFLKYKYELINYGYEITKISLKEEIIKFHKRELNILLETKRLIIYPLTIQEMKNLILKTKDKELKKAYKEMLDGATNYPALQQWYIAWNIKLKNGTTIGDLCFKGISDDKTVEVGYGITSKYQNKGYGTEAVNKIIEWALKEGAKRIEAETDPNNKASQRVLEKCGFIPLGINGLEGPRFVYKII